MTSMRLRSIRCLRLLTLLQSRTLANAEQLGKELGVCRRTIFRYLRILEEAGGTVWYDSSLGAYVLADWPHQPSCQWTEEELVALILAVRASPLTRNRDLSGALRQALHKVLAQVPEVLRSNLLRLEKSCAFVGTGPSCLAGKTAILSTIVQGIRCRRRVKITNVVAAKEKPETLLSPYLLTVSPDGWQVVGWSTTHDRVWQFSLESILQAELTKASFPVPRHFQHRRRPGI